MKRIIVIALAFVPFWFTVASAQVTKAISFEKTIVADSSGTAVVDTFYVTKPLIGGRMSVDTVNTIATETWAHYSAEQFLFVRLLSGTDVLDTLYVEAKNVDPNGFIVDNDSTYAFGGPSTRTTLAVDKPKGGSLAGLDGGPPTLALIVTIDTIGTFRLEFVVVFRSNVEYRR